MAQSVHLVTPEAVSGPHESRHETSQLRLERELHAESPCWSNGLVSAGPGPGLQRYCLRRAVVSDLSPPCLAVAIGAPGGRKRALPCEPPRHRPRHTSLSRGCRTVAA